MATQEHAVQCCGVLQPPQHSCTYNRPVTVTGCPGSVQATAGPGLLQSDCPDGCVAPQSLLSDQAPSQLNVPANSPIYHSHLGGSSHPPVSVQPSQPNSSCPMIALGIRSPSLSAFPSHCLGLNDRYTMCCMRCLHQSSPALILLPAGICAGTLLPLRRRGCCAFLWTLLFRIA